MKMETCRDFWKFCVVSLVTFQDISFVFVEEQLLMKERFIVGKLCGEMRNPNWA